MSKVLVIEDDIDIAELIDFNLQAEGFQVTLAHDGVKGFDLIKKINPSLIILDLMLPMMDGLEICRLVKADPATKKIPILMLTAKGTETDRVVGFELGADDYITKPFSVRELILRVKAILRRVDPKKDKLNPRNQIIELEHLYVDPERFLVKVDDEEVRLTAIEFKLLCYLHKIKGRVASRDVLLDQVWGYDSALTTRTVDTHVKRLRQKLNKAGDYIETIRGVGYRFRDL
jgi:two-component system phosphate regulon response regulator PhoB